MILTHSFWIFELFLNQTKPFAAVIKMFHASLRYADGDMQTASLYCCAVLFVLPLIFLTSVESLSFFSHVFLGAKEQRGV